MLVAFLVLVAVGLSGASTAAVDEYDAASGAPASSDRASTPAPPSLHLDVRPVGTADPPATKPAVSRSSDAASPEAAAPHARVRVIDATRPPAAPPAVRPTAVTVARLGIDLPLVAVGVEKDQSMELPGTIRRAGWYRFGATPSQLTGTTVIAAHVDTRREGLGPFARLADARRGDRIVVLDADSDRVTYVVTTRRYINRAKLPVDRLFTREGQPRLVLITCGGLYSAATGYSDNLVVVAVPVR